MLIRVFQAIDNDVWKLTFHNDVQEMSEDDKNRMRKYGQPEIEMGGEFSYGEGEEAGTYTLPLKKAKLRTDFPFTQEFDAKSEDFEDDTQTKVLAYKTTILARIETALEELRTATDTFTGEYTYNL